MNVSPCPPYLLWRLLQNWSSGLRLWALEISFSSPSICSPLQVTLWEAPGSMSPGQASNLLGHDWESITEVGWNHEGRVGGRSMRGSRLGKLDTWPGCTCTPLTHRELHHLLPLLLSPRAAMFTVDHMNNIWLGNCSYLDFITFQHGYFSLSWNKWKEFFISHNVFVAVWSQSELSLSAWMPCWLFSFMFYWKTDFAELHRGISCCDRSHIIFSSNGELHNWQFTNWMFYWSGHEP